MAQKTLGIHITVAALLILINCCSTIEKSEMEGLWSLEYLSVDGNLRPVPPVFIDFSNDNSVAISKTSGDVLGFYRLGSRSITFKSEDPVWFNSKWQLSILQGELWLRGKDIPYRTTELRFKKIEGIPSFKEFEEKLVGRWKMYKVRKEGDPEIMDDTYFEFDPQGYYSIQSGNQVVESGQATVDTRHRKMIFLSDETSWDIWFYGEELRLESKSRGVQYSLRKP